MLKLPGSEVSQPFRKKNVEVEAGDIIYGDITVNIVVPDRKLPANTFLVLSGQGYLFPVLDGKWKQQKSTFLTTIGWDACTRSIVYRLYESNKKIEET